MDILTEKGIAKPMPLSDIQEYNERLAYQGKWLKAAVIVIGSLGTSFLLLILWLIYYVIHNNVLNNIVARCVC